MVLVEEVFACGQLDFHCDEVPVEVVVELVVRAQSFVNIIFLSH